MLKIKHTVLIVPLIKERGWFLTLPNVSVPLPGRISVELLFFICKIQCVISKGYTHDFK